jgi:F0F1-type ATP synthase membrane subunit b/b'
MIIPLGPLTIKIDVLIVQIINIGLLLFLFKKLFGDAIVAEIKNRKELMSKITNADGEYKKIIDTAEEEKMKLIEEGKAHKAHLLQEAKKVAAETEQSLKAKAHEEAQSILSAAELKAQSYKKEIDIEFIGAVKQTAKSVVKKLINTDKEIQSQYLDQLISEIKK